MTRMTWRLVLTAAVVPALGIHSPAHAAPFFMGLGDLPGGSFISEARGVSADGLVAVGLAFPGGDEAFRWTLPGGIVGLGHVGFFGRGRAWAASADGSVVVGSDHTTGLEAFRWTSGGGMVGLGDFAGGIFQSESRDTSADGSVVVGWGTGGSGQEAFRWTSGGMVGLGDLSGGGVFSIGRGVSPDGSIVVGESASGFGLEAFRWEGGVMAGLGDLAGGNFFSQANALSADGSVVVGKGTSALSSPNSEAFRWSSGAMVGLGDLFGGTVSSEAFGVTADGSVVVGRGRSASGDEAFIWDGASGMRNLEAVLVADFGLGASLIGWTLSEARDISADGRSIVGLGTNPNGDIEAWIARIPEPSAFLLAALGLVALVAFGRRRVGPALRTRT